MTDWTGGFISQLLSKIPERAYRRRLEQELKDHLEELAANFLEQGLSLTEARAMALERLGSPEELAEQYLASWQARLHSPGYRLSSTLFYFNLFCYSIFMAVLGTLYLINTENFGSTAVGLYSFAAVPLSIFLIVVLLIRPQGDKWHWVQTVCIAFAVIQLPPIFCWITYGHGGFTMSGIHFSGDLGLFLHTAVLAWSGGNACWARDLMPVFNSDVLRCPNA